MGVPRLLNGPYLQPPIVYLDGMGPSHPMLCLDEPSIIRGSKNCFHKMKTSWHMSPGVPTTLYIL